MKRTKQSWLVEPRVFLDCLNQRLPYFFESISTIFLKGFCKTLSYRVTNRVFVAFFAPLFEKGIVPVTPGKKITQPTNPWIIC